MHGTVALLNCTKSNGNLHNLSPVRVGVLPTLLIKHMDLDVDCGLYICTALGATIVMLRTYKPAYSKRHHVLSRSAVLNIYRAGVS